MPSEIQWPPAGLDPELPADHQNDDPFDGDERTIQLQGGKDEDYPEED